MAETSKIEWCDSTFNPWIGCTKISPACDHCYAEARMDHQYKRVKWGGTRQRTKTWHEPARWQRQAETFFAEHGRRRRVFCASLADVFDNQVPDVWRADLWDLIRACPDLDWLLLTKRPQNIAKMLPAFWDEVKGHVWLGTTVEDQQRADQNIPHLLQHDCAVRFVSIEPMLGPVDLMRVSYSKHGYGPLWAEPLTGWTRADGHGYRELDLPNKLDWVIVGGESGPQARPSHPDWFRGLRDQCAAAGTPFLFKQWGACLGGKTEDTGDAVYFNAASCNRDSRLLAERDDFDWFNPENAPEGPAWLRLTKQQAGRLLDGVEHNGFPEVQHD